MIFEKLDFTTNNKMIQTRPKTPVFSNLLFYRKSIKHNIFVRGNERSSRFADFPYENYRVLFSVQHRMQNLDTLTQEFKHKFQVSDELSQKSRYVRAYTPNEKVIAANDNRTIFKNEQRCRSGVSTRKIYKKALQKTNKEFTSEEIVGWINE